MKTSFQEKLADIVMAKSNEISELKEFIKETGNRKLQQYTNSS